jgi:CHAT domain
MKGGDASEFIQARLAAAISSPGGMDAAAVHNDALDMLDEALARRDLPAVDQAISYLEAAVLAARGDRAEPFFLTSLGSAWLERFEITGRAADIGHAITAHRRAIAVPAPTWAEEAGRRANYSSALLKRFEQQADLADLDEALAAARAAAELARRSYAALAAGAMERGQAGGVLMALHASLSSLSQAALASFEYRQDREDLDQAIRAARESAGSTAPGDPALAARLANLAQVLLERFTWFRRAADLDEAFTAATAAARAVPAGHPARALCLSALALAYTSRFSHTGDPGDLDQAIDAGWQAVHAVPDGHPGQAGCLSNLGGALNRKFETVGDTQALDQAIDLHRRAAGATPAGARRPRFLNNLGNALRSHFAVAGQQADIQESVTVLREAVAAAPSTETGRAGYVADLGLSLAAAADQRTGLAGVDQAITMLEREAGTIGDDHPLRHVYFAAVGYAWRACWSATSDDGALRSAITWFGKAAEAAPSGHPHHAEHLTSLGAAQLSWFECTGDTQTGWQALAHSKTAATAGAAPAFTRALAARNWGQAAAGLGEAHEAAEGFASAVNLLDTVAWRGVRRGDQERQLAQFVALASDAAAWALESGQPERAVELLEQGRGVLLARALHQRARHHDLEQEAPGLAADLDAADRALDQLTSARGTLTADAGNLARRAELTAQRDALLGQIRQLPGLADFLLPPEFANLRDAATDGPVVITNVSRYRCDALTITTSGVTVTRLTGLTSSDVALRAAGFIHALQHLPSQSAEVTITETLGWLWDSLVSPLLPGLSAAAAAPAGPRRPRVWWCPTGPLTFLPLHAAGHHGTRSQAVIDLFTCSYAPTLRLLQRSRQQAPPTPASASPPLLVALPATPGLPDIPDATTEADAFARRFQGATQLRGATATATATKAALETCPPWAHFACHGTQDISDPSAGHLALHDGPLSIEEIAGLRLQQTELAFLSACETSRGGAALADESITLATAFHLAGYRHVIGTLWSISDELAPAAADHVYGILSCPGEPGIDASKAALALDTAVLALRDDCPLEPSLWAPYVHTGP